MNIPTPNTGFSFGQQPNAKPAIASSNSSFSFGQSAGPSQPGTGFSFGSTSQPGTTATVNPLTSTSGFSFGSTSSNTAPQPALGGGFSIGQVSANASTGALNLGQANPTASSSSGFSFGQTAPASSFSGFNLGQTTASAASTSPALNAGLNTSVAGQQATSTGTGFGFGLTTSSAPGNISTGLFGQMPSASVTSTGTTNLFGQTPTTTPTATSGGLFGLSTASTTPGLLGQSGGGLFGPTSTQQTQPTTGLNFGLSTSSASGTLFNQASSASTPSTLNLANPATSSTPNVGLGGSVPTSTAAGLGGFQTSSADAGVGSLGSGASKGDGKSAKEAPLPQDIFATIAIFESNKDIEKKCSEDNIRQTATPFHKLVEDTKKLRQHIVKLSNQHNKLHSSAQKLKSMVIQEAENVEMARRTQDTPMNLQGDNKAPEQFFLRLIRSFEERMSFCRNRIEEVEKCARSNGAVNEITSEDMKEVLKKEHEMVKMLAAKLYTLHNQLINYTNHSSHPDMQPEALFKSHSHEQHPLAISNKNSNILRPALGEGGSGLLNFQNGQQRAKAVSLGAAPPTLPLMQTSIPNLLGSSNQNTLFTGSSNSSLGSSFLNFSPNPSSINNNQPSFGGFGNKTAFGGSQPNTSSLFSSPTMNANQSSGLFGSPANASNNTSLFGAAKNFKK